MEARPLCKDRQHKPCSAAAVSPGLKKAPPVPKAATTGDGGANPGALAVGGLVAVLSGIAVAQQQGMVDLSALLSAAPAPVMG